VRVPSPGNPPILGVLLTHFRLFYLNKLSCFTPPSKKKKRSQCHEELKMQQDTVLGHKAAYGCDKQMQCASLDWIPGLRKSFRWHYGITSRKICILNTALCWCNISCVWYGWWWFDCLETYEGILRGKVLWGLQTSNGSAKRNCVWVSVCWEKERK
jgi:hypothetical protein